jgi:acrylyl-CoA reductase (NADPH)
MDGGFSEVCRVPAEWLVALPEAMSERRAMAIGTAGFTAMQCVLALG